jgi:hypothetical protein
MKEKEIIVHNKYYMFDYEKTCNDREKCLYLKRF